MTITTLNLISKQTVGAAGAASVTFSNIPQTYTDLKVVVSARVTTSATYEELTIVINGVSTNLSTRYLYALSGTGTGSGSYASGDYRGIVGVNAGATATASTFGSSEIYITNYASTTTYKSISGDGVGENNATSTVELIAAALNSSNSAITQIGFISPTSANFVQYSTFTLYGVSSNTVTQNASVPYALGGNIIATDGSYWYHQFLYSGTFTPLKAITCDYLVVAGGGGGGNAVSGDGTTGGGGGGGGMRSTVTATGGSGSLESALSLSLNTNYTVTVGAGGAGGVSSSAGSNGSNSVFSTITSAGGGGGGTSSNGAEGASGGGGGGNSNNGNTMSGGAASPANQGFAGGTGKFLAGTYRGAGGGGGASAVGGNGVTSTGGVGGAGRATSISGSSVTYAGGGGGSGDTPGQGGTGGGGRGAETGTGPAIAGTANTGGGAGGFYYGASGTSQPGGSGIVIVRYAV